LVLLLALFGRGKGNGRNFNPTFLVTVKKYSPNEIL